MGRVDAADGQAAVELVASAPILLLAALVAFQLMVVGYTHSIADGAAEAAALALAGGSSAKDAAEQALPDWARDQARVSTDGGHVAVSLAAPSPFAVIGLAPRVSADVWVRPPEASKDAS